MLALVVVLAAAASAAPNQPPFKGRANPSAFLDDAYQAEALARFHTSIGGQEELGKIQSALRAFTDGLEPLPELSSNAVAASSTHDDLISDHPSIADINKPIAAYLYGGDIMIHPSSFINDTRHKRGAPVIVVRKWNKTQPIAFGFNSDIKNDVRELIRTSTKKIAENTCLNFKENGSGAQLHFHRGGGCWSNLGQSVLSGTQPISIDSGCDIIGIISHEITHALGIMHTQARKDRDAYVTVNNNELNENMLGQFNKLPDSYNDNFGVPYEYGSAMHYAANSFSISGRDVIIAKETGYERTMGQRKYMTFNDYKLINILYKCNETCKNSITCQNGGYQSYKNCNTCICPEFYTGTNCQTPKNAIAVSESAPVKTVYKQAYNETLYYSNNFYTWDMFGKDSIKLITAPAGRKIRVTINQLSAYYGYEGCYAKCQFFGLEFVDTANSDLTSVGKLFCCEKKDVGFSFVSKSNLIGYKAYASPGMPFDSQVTFTLV